MLQAIDIQSLLAPSGTLLGLVLLRALPIVAYVAISTRFAPWTKYLVVVAAGLWFLLTLRFDPLAEDLLRYAPVLAAYFVAAVAISIVVRVPVARLGRGGVFLHLLTLFLVVPALLPLGRMKSLGIILGWEFLLASFSICVDGYRQERTPAPAEHVVFVLVNPVLVYAERGRVTGLCRPASLWRSALGIAALYAGTVLTRTASTLNTSPFGAESLLVGAALFLGTYWKHSGLASLQIGLMRFVGHDVPERYRHPLSAESPTDFWRRWNVYVGSWARRYLFTPMATHLARTRTLTGEHAKGLAAVGTFLGIGVLHDLTASLITQRLFVGWSLFFLWHGAVVVSWEAVRSRSSRRVVAGRPCAPAIGRLVGWGLTMAVLSLGAALLASAIQQGRGV